MGIEETVLAIVDEIYAAAESPDRWNGVLAACASAVGCEPAGLYSHDLRGGTASVGVAINCAASAH